MKKLFFLLLSVISINIYSQTDNVKAAQLKNEAIELMDNGQIIQSIELLNQAKALDPDNYAYDYEIGYAHYLNKDYNKSIKYFKKVIKYKNSTDQCYQMLGNIYDIIGKSSKALKVYDKGLEIFPNSGRLFLEKGTVYYLQQNYKEALKYYEMGIFHEPMYPSNYFRAAYMFLNSDEKVWGMLYGEIFRNLEPFSERSKSMSNMLFENYASQINFSSDTSMSVSFTKQNNISINLDSKDIKKDLENFLQNFKITYGLSTYEPVLLTSLIGQDTINLESLNIIRTNFANNYYTQINDKSEERKPMVLIDFQKKMIKLGIFEAYNYWLLGEGNTDDFNAWINENPEKWKNFKDWFAENTIYIDSENIFHSSIY